MYQGCCIWYLICSYRSYQHVQLWWCNWWIGYTFRIQKPWTQLCYLSVDVRMKVRGCGTFGAYSTLKPRKCFVDSLETEFTYDSARDELISHVRSMRDNQLSVGPSFPSGGLLFFRRPLPLRALRICLKIYLSRNDQPYHRRWSNPCKSM